MAGLYKPGRVPVVWPSTSGNNWPTPRVIKHVSSPLTTLEQFFNKQTKIQDLWVRVWWTDGAMQGGGSPSRQDREDSLQRDDKTVSRSSCQTGLCWIWSALVKVTILLKKERFFQPISQCMSGLSQEEMLILSHLPGKSPRQLCTFKDNFMWHSSWPISGFQGHHVTYGCGCNCWCLQLAHINRL